MPVRGARKGLLRRRIRGLTIAVIALLALAWTGTTADAAELSKPATVHLPSMAQIEAWFQSPHWGWLPAQRGGSADGKAHEVSAAATRAGGGAGHKPGKGKGELPAYALYRQKGLIGPSAPGGGSFDPKTSVFDASKSSATVSWYRNQDGSITKKVAQQPVNYQIKPGVWAPIDTTLTGTGSGRVAEKSNSLGVSFAARSGGAVGTTTQSTSAASPSDLADVAVSADQSIGWSLSGAKQVAASVTGNTATYASILPGVSLSEQAGPTGDKESIVLSSPAAGDSWTFPLNVKGLTPSLDAEGAVQFKNAAGAVVARIPLAYAYDSKVNPHTGDPATTWNVKYSLAAADSGYTLTVTVDPNWLNDPARVYPVTVDPTLIVSIVGTVSTTYTDSTVTGDFSSDTRIKEGECTAADCGTQEFANSFIKFPTFPDGQGYYATSASLTMFDTWTATSIGSSKCTQANASQFSWSSVYVAPITQGWSVTGSKAYPGPSYGASIGNGAPATWNACTNTGASLTTGDWVSISLDPTYLNYWSYNAQPDYGLAVYGATGALTWRKYDSDMESNYTPYLSVTYVDQAPQVNSQYPPNGYSASTLTPELLASASRPANSQTTTALTYDFVVYDGSNNKVADSGNVSTGDWTVPSGDLKWGQTYYWTVTSSDGTLSSVAKPLESISIAVPQPVITSALSQNQGHGFDQATGNYTTSATDADVSTVGPQLQVVRDYNSRDPRTTGAFGAAWSSVFDARATEQYNAAGAVTSVTVTYPDGSQVGFGKNSDGTFAPPSGRFATFKTASTGYTLTDKNDTLYTFAQSLGSGAYGITAITDANGRAVNFTWSSGQITTMTSAVSGRALHLTWATPSGAAHVHVATVFTDPVTGTDQNTDLTWKYLYTGDQLTEVCDPKNSGCTGATSDVATKYTYTTGNLYQSAVLDAGAHSLWPLSETTPSTAYSAVIANEGNDNGTYTSINVPNAGPFSGSTAGSASFNGTSSALTLPSSLVMNSTYLSLSMWFKTTSTSTGTLFSTGHSAVGATSPSGAAMPVLYVGSDGLLHGHFWDGTVAGIASTAKVNDGTWHQVVLSAAGNKQTLFLDGAALGSLSNQLSNVDPYDLVGAGVYNSNGWPAAPSGNVWNYFNGQIADVGFFTRPLVAADVTGLNTAGKTTASLLTKITRPSGKTYASVSYDGDSARVTSVTDENGGTWRLYAPTVTGTSDAYRAAVMGSAPAGYYRLADTAGSSSAYSEVNYGAGTYNNVTLGVAGPFTDRTAASFNGTSSYLQLPQSDQVSTGPNSVELWFNMTAGDVNGGVLFDEEQCPINNNPTCGGWNPALYVGTDGRLHGQFWINSIGATIDSGQLVNDGKWHHVVLAATTNSQTMYLDGNAVGTQTGTLSATALGYIYVGAGEAGGSWKFAPTNSLGYFSGSIAEMAFYRTQLSATEVAAHYAAYQSGVSGVSPTQVNGVADPGSSQVTIPFDGTSYSASAGHTWQGEHTHLIFQADGNLVIYRNDTNAPIWASNTAGNSSATLTFQTDGNLVIYNGSTPLWATSTNYSPNNTATLRADGNLEIDSPSGHQKWTAGAVLPAATNVLTYKYDAVNGDRLMSETDATGATTSYGYDTSGFTHTVTDADGDVTTTGHDVRGNVVSQTTCQNQAAQTCSSEYFTYYPDDATAQLTTADPRNDLTLTSRDGRSSSATDPTYLTSYTYDAAGDRTAVTTPPVPGFPAGRTTSITYSDGTAAFPAADSGNVPAGLPMTTVSPGGAVNRVAYFHNGDVASTTDADGQVTTYTYDGVGRTVSKTVNPGSPTAWWRLNQTSGTAIPDASGTGNGVTASNVTWSGGVGAFNGTSSQITAAQPTVNTASSFTLSAWVNLPSVPSGQADVIALSGTNQYSAFLQYSPYSKAWQFAMTSADVPYSSSAPSYYVAAATGAPATGTWTHLVGVYDEAANTAKLYVNGTLASSASVGSSWTAKTMTVGSGGGQYYFNGSIANVQMYQRALATSDVTTLYGAGYSGSTVSSTTPNGLVTSLSYDQLGQVVTQTDPAVTNRVTGAVHTATTTTVYDADGDVTSQTVADSAAGGDSSRTVSAAYNAYDEEQTSTDGNGNTTTISYDAYGNKTGETGPDGAVTNSTYDADGRLLTQSLANYTGDPENPSTARTLTEVSKAYDPAGRLASSTDSMGNVTSYTYTDNGLVSTVTRADSTGANKYVMQSTTYDAAGNVISKATGNGSLTTAYTVDAADRTTKSVLDPTGVDRTTTVSFTPDDAVASSTETDPGGWDRTATYTYDAMGNKTSQSLNLDASGHPVGWWPLTQTKGTTTTDASGTGNTMNATGVTWTGSSASFNGTSSVMATNGPALTTTSSYSISAWVNLASTSQDYQTIVGQSSTDGGNMYLEYSPTFGGWSFILRKADNSASGLTSYDYASSNTGVAANTWTHLAAVYNSSTGAMQLYVNGTLAASATDTTPWQANGLTTIGAVANAGGSWNYTNGQIANVQVYQRALAGSDVSTLYSAGRTSGTTASSSWQTTSWQRDVRGLPVSQTDANGNTTSYTYDEAGHLAVTVAPAVSSEVYGSSPVQVHPTTYDGYDTFGEETQSEDANGNITTTVYDADGNKASQTLPPYTPPGSSTPITATSTWSYDKNGSLISETDPAGNTTSYTYDQLGDEAQVTTPDGGVTHKTYDTNGDELTVTDPTGAQTQATYDWLGRKITSTTLERYPTAQTLTSTFSYAASAMNPGGSNMASVTTPDGATTSYGYNAVGDKTQTIDGAGNSTKYSYNFMDDPFVTTYADNTSSEVDYNAAEQAITTKNYDASGALLTSQSATYDAVGNLLSSVDARGNTTTYTYDPTNTVTQEVQRVSASSSITTSFGYDAAGNQTRYTDGRGTNWYTTYNSWGLKESQVEPTTSTYTTAAASTTTYAYNQEAQLATETLPGGVTQSFTYDKMGDLLTASGAGAAATTATRTFTYDLGGRITSAATSNTSSTSTSNATSESFTYNDRSNLLTASGSAGSTTFGYNGDGLLTSRNDASGSTTYAYDNADRVLNATDAATGTTLTYGYNSLDQVSSIAYGSGDTRSYSYNSLHQLTGDTLKTGSGSTVASIAYGYDANGNLTSKNTTGFGSSASNTYTYDYANRLTSWNNGSTTTAYSYDAAGNRTQVGSNVYTYDARDELTSDGVNSYAYTAYGTLASQTTTSANNAYTSDAFGQEVTAGAAAYTYDALGRVVNNTNTSTLASTAIQYSGTDNHVAADGAYVYTHDANGSLLGVNTVGGATATGQLVLTDQHTDVVGDFTASASALAGSTTYDPLGNVVGTSTKTGNLGYQSEYTDSGTGQVNMASRWYNPAVGQFTSKDTITLNPVGNSANANPFAYAADDPMTGTDPTGHCWICSVWNDAVSTVSTAWNDTTSFVSSAWNDTSNFVDDEIWRPMRHVYQVYVAPVVHTAFHYATTVYHHVSDAWHRTYHWVSHQVHRAWHAVKRAYHAAIHVVKTAYHATVHAVNRAYHAAAKAVTHAVKSAVTFVKHHAAAIASFALSTVAFMGCEAVLGAVTGGVGAVAGAVACGAFSGMVGGLVDQGAKCVDGQKGACSVGSFVKAGLVGGVTGAAGGVLGSVGGKLLGKLAPKALDAVGGLFGRGGSEALDAGAGDAAQAGASTESRAATQSAESGVDNPGEASKAADDGAASEEGASCSRSVPTHSFTGSTPVLMANGSTKQIDQIKVGDQIANAVPGQDTTQSNTVTNVIVTKTDHDFVNLTVEPLTASAANSATTASAKSTGVAAKSGLKKALATAAVAAAVTSGAGTAHASTPSADSAQHGGTITTTFHHPFYDITQAAFVDAQNLKSGDELQTPTGDAVIISVRLYHANTVTYDLTIGALHTYYVVAGSTPVLVHNANRPEECGPEGSSAPVPRGIRYEKYLQDRLGAQGGFKGVKRQFDGKIVNDDGSEIWYEAKSGNALSSDDEIQAFKNQAGEQLREARSAGAGYMVISENPVPESVSKWLMKKGIPWMTIPWGKP